LSKGRTRAGQDRLPILGLLALAVVLFSKAIFTRWVFWQRDIQLYWYAQVESFVQVVSGGAPPLWNPFISFGLPLLADPSCQVLYPFTWLNLLTLPSNYYKVYVLFHVTAAGVGLYLLSRSWGLSRSSAFVGGAVWIASGPFLVVVSHYHHFAGMAWIPWVLLALEVALRSRTVGAALGLGGAAGLQVFAGSGDVCLMTGLICAARIVVFVAHRGTLSAETWRTAAFVTVIASAFAAAVSAAQWLPTLAILKSGLRLQMDPSGNMYWSLHPASLPDLFAFRLVADLPISAAVRAALYESREPLFACLYLGAAAPAFVGIGLLRHWNQFKVFSAAGFVISLLAALGRHTVVYPVLLKTTPLFLFRFPSKYMIAVGFFWGALAGLAAEDWVRPSEASAPRRFRPALAIAGALAATALAGALWLRSGPDLLLRALDPDIGSAAAEGVLWRSSAKVASTAALVSLAAILIWIRGRDVRAAAWTTPLLVILVVGDLVWYGRDVNPLAPPEMLASRPEVVRRLPAHSRTLATPHWSREWFARQVVRGPRDWEWQWNWALGLQEVLWPPTGARWGLSGSYDGDFTGLAPPLSSNLTMILNRSIGTPLGLRLLQVGGVEYVISLEPWPGLESAGEFQSVFASPVRLFAVPRTLPRAYVVGNVRLAGEPDSVYLIGDSGFDPSREVILPPGMVVPPLDAAFRGEVRMLWRRADGLGLTTDTSAPGYVVVLDTYYPGWTATVDGTPADVLRANVMFRAVAVPAGKHTVTLKYRPASVVWGLSVSAVSVIFGLASWSWISRRRWPGAVQQVDPPADAAIASPGQ